MRTTVIINKQELDGILRLASTRNNKEKKFGAMTYGSRRGSLEAHHIGMIGEFAVAKLYGVNVDSRVFDGHGDDGIDLYIPRIGKVSVKTTTYVSEPFLRVEKNHFLKDVNAYVLCAVGRSELQKEQIEVNVIGWATAQEVQNGEVRQFVRGGPTNYVLKESCLHDIHEIIRAEED